MDKNILESIRSTYYQLTDAERRTADLVLEQYDRVQYMSISELAEAGGVSEATITRFCKRVGVGGFNRFKMELAGCVARSQEAAATGDDLSDRVLAQGKKLCEAVQQTLQLTDAQQIRTAVDILKRSGYVMCVGAGSGAILAAECAHVFGLISHKFVAVTDSHRQIMTAATMGKEDAVVLFSYSGATKDAMELLQFAKEQQTAVILVTRHKRSPVARLADVVLCCGSQENPYQTGSVSAAVAQLCLVEVLFQEYCRQDKEACEANIRRVAAGLAIKHL